MWGSHHPTSSCVFPCHQNRGKIDDFIAIFGPINCALYRDTSRFRQKSVVNRDLIDGYDFEKSR
jgi:hypothetical protein